MSSLAALLALTLAASAGDAPAYDLRVNEGADVVVTAAAAALSLALAAPQLSASHCRLCTPGAIDDETREAVVWRNPAAARTASDVLANLVIPVGALAALALQGHAQGGGLRDLADDALVVLESAAVAQVFCAASKDAFARARPGLAGNDSFYSGHTSLAFSIATAAATVASMRGYRGARWMWAVGLSLAATVGYLRLAGDAHWLSDVAVGAAAGGTIGFAVPWTFHRRRRRGGSLDVALLPNGIAIAF